MTERNRTVGPWTLVDRIDEGGNGVVWLATDSSGKSVALKLLKARRAQVESYKRFVREITFLREHQGISGLLPLIDAYLPDDPTRDDRPWLAMPVATPIARALGNRPALEDVVGAVSTIAQTLVALGDHDIAHRDIKPGNLYQLEGKWVIGDFGLISLPDGEALTKEGRQVGPANFTAYEMIANPTTADPHPADVFSLGKTLWVLATGQNWPPLGHQPVKSGGFGISDFQPHRNAVRLDELVERTTRLRPEERPTKAQLAADLAAWLELPAAPIDFDISGLRASFREKLRGVLSEAESEARLRAAEQRAIRRVQELSRPLNDSLKDVVPGTQIDSPSDETTINLVRSRLDMGGRAQLLHRWQRCTIVAGGDRPGTPELTMGRSIEVFNDGRLAFTWMVLVAPQKVVGGVFFNQGTSDVSPAESVEVDGMLERQVRAMSNALKEAVEVFCRVLPAG